MSVFNYQKDNDGIVTITMDMTGPVNAMNAEYSVVMGETIDRLESDEGIKGVIFASAKKTFFAGGDLKELLEIQPGDEQFQFERIEKEKGWLRRLEKLPVPALAAINGAALGGGMEICLACNRRIAWSGNPVVVGLPEVTLGLLPGAGGVVRMTNLLGFEKALPYLLEGRKLNAVKALDAGLVDEVVDDLDQLLPQARAWILANHDNPEAAQQPWDREKFKIPGGNINHPAIATAVQFAPYQVMKKTRGLLPAPERILETVVEALRLPFDVATRVETRKFVSLLVSPEAKNMINAFFFQMNEVNGGANRPGGVEPDKIAKLGVIGAGMMGQGIAYVAANEGIEVVLKDVSIEAAEKGKGYSEKLLDKAIERGRADEAKKTAVLERIQATDKDDDLEGCDLIVEAVFEDIELKNSIVKANESRLVKDGVWGTNTSTLPITRLAEASAKPNNFVGIHFFSPVDRMPLVELICGEETSDETLAKAFDFVRQLRKTPIVVNDAVGFFTSRTFLAQLLEAAEMLVEGVHPHRLDAMGKAIGMPVGPLTVSDEIGQRLCNEIIETQLGMGLKCRPSENWPQGVELINKMVKEFDRGGRQFGGGYYEYGDSDKYIWPGLIDTLYMPKVEVSDEDIKDRLLFSNVLESLHCLQEGVLRSVADGNIGSLLGIGAPTWTGGYLQFVNTYGLQRFIDRCDELAQRYGDRFRAPAIVAEKLATGETFH